jgi:hypothetical protein
MPWSRIQRRVLSLLLAASIFGAMFGMPSVLCIEADGRGHHETFAEVCCSPVNAPASRGPGAGFQADGPRDCGDCRDVIVAAKLAWRPVERGASILPAAGPLTPLSPLLPLFTSTLHSRGQDGFIAPVLLALRTVVISC